MAQGQLLLCVHDARQGCLQLLLGDREALPHPLELRLGGRPGGAVVLGAVVERLGGPALALDRLPEPPAGVTLRLERPLKRLGPPLQPAGLGGLTLQPRE